MKDFGAAVDADPTVADAWKRRGQVRSPPGPPPGSRLSLRERHSAATAPNLACGPYSGGCCRRAYARGCAAARGTAVPERV